MRNSRQKAAAASVVAVLATMGATTAHGQTGSVEARTGLTAGSAFNHDAREKARVFEAMRNADQDRKRATDPIVISTTELVRARAAGEMPMTESTTARVREFVRAETGERVYAVGETRGQVNNQVPAKAREHASAVPQTKTTVDSKSIVDSNGRLTSQGAIVRLPDPPNGKGLQITEAARAAEHARYEASKKRRATETAAILSSEQRVSEQVKIVTKAEYSASPRVEIGRYEASRTAEQAGARRSEQADGRTADETRTTTDAMASEARARDILSGLR